MTAGHRPKTEHGAENLPFVWVFLFSLWGSWPQWQSKCVPTRGIALIPADWIRGQIEIFSACDAVSKTTLTTEVIANLIVISPLYSPRVDDGVAATRSTH